MGNFAKNSLRLKFYGDKKIECLVEAKFHASSDEFFCRKFYFSKGLGPKNIFGISGIAEIEYFCDKSLPMHVKCLLKSKFYAGSDGEKKNRKHTFQNTIARAF